MYFCIWSSCAYSTLVTVTWCLLLLGLLLPFPLYCLLLLVHPLFVLCSPLRTSIFLPSPLPSSRCSPCITFPFLSHSSLPSLSPLIPSLPAHLDLSGSSTGDDLSLLPFCKEPALSSEGEGLSLDHMRVSEGEWQEGQ